MTQDHAGSTLMAFETIDEHLAAQPTLVREKLGLVRAAIKRAVPEAEEVISYQIPAFRIGGRVFIFFAGWAKHFSIYPVGDALLQAFGSELAAFEISKGTIRFPLDEPVPEDLIFRIAKFKAAETQVGAPRKPPL
jgi:uncharacterized protein YdhG (YjbR/CyaY superfamily)